MFHGCDLSFSSLQEFKQHITEGHKEEREKALNIFNTTPKHQAPEPPQPPPATPKAHELKQEQEQKPASVIEVEVVAEGAVLPELETADNDAVDAFLKLCELHKHEDLGSSKAKAKPVLIETKAGGSNVLPLLSPHHQTAKTFYSKSPMASSKNKLQSPLSPVITNVVSTQLTETRVSGRKRKLTDMSVDELAHLTLRMQDKISSLQESVHIAQKQLSAVRSIYRKRAKVARS